MFFASGLSHAGEFNFVYSEQSEEIKLFLKGFAKNNIDKISDFSEVQVSSIQSCSSESTYIAFGTTVANQILKNCPIVKLIVSDSEYNIINFEAKVNRKYPAIFVDQSVRQQAKLIKKNIPHFNEIGILYQTEHELSAIAAAERFTNVNFSAQKVANGESPGPYFRDLIKNVDGILITTNTNIWQKKDIRGFLLYSLRQGKVMLGGPTKDYVKAGVFAGVYTDMEQLGEKASLAIIGRNHQQLRLYPDDGHFIFNRFLASRLSIQVTDE